MVQHVRSEEQSSFFVGHCTRSDSNEFEVWIHIEAADHGFVLGESESTLSRADLAELERACVASSGQGGALLTIVKGDDEMWRLRYKDLEMLLEFERQRLDAEEVYEASMRYISESNVAWGNRLRKAQNEALEVVQKSKNTIIGELNKRNRRIRELEQELKQTRSRIVSLSQSPTKSPVKREHPEHEEEGAPLAPTQSYPFMGINRSRTSLSSSPVKPVHQQDLMETTQPSPDPVLMTDDAPNDDESGDEDQEDTDVET